MRTTPFGRIGCPQSHTQSTSTLRISRSINCDICRYPSNLPQRSNNQAFRTAPRQRGFIVNRRNHAFALVACFYYCELIEPADPNETPIQHSHTISSRFATLDRS